MEFFSSSSSSSSSILGLETHFNSDGWGPRLGEQLPSFEDVPYAHFDKKERAWKPADFVQQNNPGSQWNRPNKYSRFEPRNAEFAYQYDAQEDQSFQLVDTSKTQTKKYSGGKKGYQQGGRGGGAGGAGRGAQGGRGNRAARGGGRDTNASAGRGGRGGRFGRGAGGRGGRGYRRNDRKFDRQPSLTVQAEWEIIEEIDLSQLLKLVANPPVVEDLMWAGHLDQYDDNFDKVNTKSSKPLRRIENKVFYYVSTSEDPVLEKFAVENVGNVYATDTILAHLMAAPRSIYSWDLVIQKIGGCIYLDRRENSTFDLLTVSETAHEPPTSSDDSDEINHPEKLSLEATAINQNFSQQILKEDTTARKTYEPNPFFEVDEDAAGMEPASVAYRYRKFTLGNIKVVARCELHGWAIKRDHKDEQLFTSYALNEWDSRYSGGIDWRRKIDTQRGAVLATELKNNSNKLAKWTAQSILAGADIMKIGYVSRLANTNSYEHTILATQAFKPKDIASQINLGINNIWGIIKMISDLLMKQEDGKFVLLKDPNKPTIRLYSVPANTFEEEDEEPEEEDAGEGEEEEKEEA